MVFVLFVCNMILACILPCHVCRFTRYLPICGIQIETCLFTSDMYSISRSAPVMTTCVSIRDNWPTWVVSPLDMFHLIWSFIRYGPCTRKFYLGGTVDILFPRTLGGRERSWLPSSLISVSIPPAPHRGLNSIT